MASSERKRYLRFAHSHFLANSAFHAFSRDLIGNVNHLADQFAQRRLSWVAPTSSDYFEPEIGSGSIVADTYYRVWQSLPFDLHVRETGESYALRTRIRGARSTGSGTISFAVAISAEGHGAAYYAGLGNQNVARSITASSTHAWIETASSVVRLTGDQIVQSAQDVQTADAIGGTAVSAQWLRCTAEVWAATSIAASVPRLSGLQIDEYYAP